MTTHLKNTSLTTSFSLTLDDGGSIDLAVFAADLERVVMSVEKAIERGAAKLTGTSGQPLTSLVQPAGPLSVGAGPISIGAAALSINAAPLPVAAAPGSSTAAPNSVGTIWPSVVAAPVSIDADPLAVAAAPGSSTAAPSSIDTAPAAIVATPVSTEAAPLAVVAPASSTAAPISVDAAPASIDATPLPTDAATVSSDAAAVSSDAAVVSVDAATPVSAAPLDTTAAASSVTASPLPAATEAGVMSAPDLVESSLIALNVAVGGTPAAALGATYVLPPIIPPALSSPPALSLGSGPDTVALFLTETAFQGDAQYEVLVNGVPTGGILTADVLQGSGQEREVDVHGNFSTHGQSVSIMMLNAVAGATPSTSRALYLDGETFDGVNEGITAALTTDGEASVFVGSPAPVTLGSGPDVIEIQASEFGFAAGAKLAVAVDGVQVVQPLTIVANSAAGATQNIFIDGLYTAGQHTVTLSLANPAAASGLASPPSLTINSVTVDGVVQASLAGMLTTSAPLTTSATFLGPEAKQASTGPAGALGSIGLEAVSAPILPAGTHVLTVGVGEEYQTIAAAVSASQDGDVILVDAGTYTNDFVTNYHKITLEAVGGRVEMVATEPPPNLKGLITEENDLTVIGFDFSGVAIDDASGGNGAGIRVDGGNLVLENDSFTGNQNGILANGGTNSITIDHSVFNDNGSGTGYTHNVYIGAVASVTVTNSIFENAQVGHEFKSRAEVNTISNSEFIDGVGIGDGSYDIDLPDGGQDTLTNDTIIKGPNSPNYAMLHYGGEGLPYAGSALTVTDTVFQSENNANAIPVLNQTALPALLTGNTFVSIQGGLVNGPATVTGSVDGNGNALPDETNTATLPTGALVYTDSAPHTLTLGYDNNALQGGAGYLTINDIAGHVLILGGTGGMDVEEGASAGGSTIDTAVGSVNLLNLAGYGMDTIDSEGTDTILAGVANQTGALNGTATVQGGSGNSSWSVNGTATFLTQTGTNLFSVGSLGVLSVLGTGSYYAITDNGGAASWNTTGDGNVLSGHGTGGFSLQNYNGMAHVTTAGGSAAVMSFDTGDVSLFSSGPDVLYAGSGTDTFIVNDGAIVYAGTGQLSVFARGGGGGATVFGAGGDTTIDGDSGGITYYGSSLANSVEARLSGITLVGGSGHLTVNNYAFGETIVGGLGGITENLLGGGGGTVTTAAGSSNTLTVSNGTVHSFGSDLITISDGGGNYDVHGMSTVTLGGGTYYGDVSGTDNVTTLAGFQHVTAEAGASVTLNASSNAVTWAQVDATASIQESLLGTSATSAATASFIASGTANLSSFASSSGLSLQTDGSGSEAVTMNGAVSMTSGGADKIHASFGSQQVALTGSGAEVWAGDGALTVQDTDYQGPSTFTLHGGSGNVSLVEYGSSTMQFIGGSGSASLSLDSQGAQITFGTGATQVTETGYGAANIYNFASGASGTELINGFRVGTDQAILTAGVMVQSQSVTSAGALFTLSNGAHLTLAGLTSTQGVFG